MILLFAFLKTDGGCSSPGVLAARDATLTFMVGGEQESFEVANEILQHIGKNVVHCGGVGTGQV